MNGNEGGGRRSRELTDKVLASRWRKEKREVIKTGMKPERVSATRKEGAGHRMARYRTDRPLIIAYRACSESGRLLQKDQTKETSFARARHRSLKELAVIAVLRATLLHAVP